MESSSRRIVQYLIALFGFIASGLATEIEWLAEPSVSDFQITSGRISTIAVRELENCMVECYVQPDCVTVGFSDVYMGCQLYYLDLADFTQYLISQPHTAFYKAVCLESGYGYIRPIGQCVKRHSTTSLPQTNASATCVAEGGSLMKVDVAGKGAYLKAILFHIHDWSIGFSYLIGGEWNSVSSMWQWMDGTPIDGLNGEMYWRSGVQDNTNGNCLAITNVGNKVGFEAVSCNANMMFFCSFTKI